MARYLVTIIVVLSMALPVAAAMKPTQQPIDVTHYNLALDLDEAAATYTGTVEVSLTTQEKLRKIWLHAEALTIDGVTLDGESLKYSQTQDRVTLRLPQKVAANTPLTLALQFRGVANPRSQDGLFVINKPDRLPAFYTQLEPIGARRLFPCHDEPFDKATTEVRLTGHAAYTLLSNGEQVAQSTSSKDRQQVHFRNDDPISTYHLTVVAAELATVRSNYRSTDGRNIPLTIYVRPGHQGEVQVALRALRESLDYFEGYFNIPYPWDRYGIVAVEGFTWSGMENKGLTNLNADRLYWTPDHPYGKKAWITGLVAHELSHEWFGNLVTMEWWNDLWLNEAFASFMTQKMVAHVFGQDYADLSNYQWLVEDYFPQDSGPLSHPIIVNRADSIGELFDGITYAKGVQVVRMLEQKVGAANFQRAIQAYLQEHEFGNATTQQFLRAIEVHTGVKVQAFAESWLTQPGYPTMTAEGTWDEATHELTLTLKQAQVKGAKARHPFRGVVKVALYGKDYTVAEELNVTKRTEVYTVALASPPTSMTINQDGNFLVASIRQAGDIPVVTTDARESSAIARLRGIEQALMQEGVTTEDATEFVRRGLNDATPEVRNGTTWALLRATQESDWVETVARNVEDDVVANLRGSATTPVTAGLQQESLRLLGSIDDAEIYSLLRSRLGHHIVDVRMGALAGLMQTSDPGRYDSFREMITRVGDNSSLKLSMLQTLAATPDTQAISELSDYLNDRALIAIDDSSTPKRVFDTLRSENHATVMTAKGVELVAAFAEANIDRPSVASAALRAFEGVKKAEPEVRGDIRQAIRQILAKKPDPLVRSIGEKILKAAR